MKNTPTRRTFLKTMMTAPALSTFSFPVLTSTSDHGKKDLPHKFKLSLNVYSFNALLQQGVIDLFDVLDFCAEYNFEAIDPTANYFPGYPEVPADEYMREFKRKAFLLGLDISGTGVRNDFANPDADSRRDDIELIRQWTEVAFKMGIPALRIFPGHHDHSGYAREEVLEWMARDIKTCCKTGEKYGVMIAVQNHNGFLKTAADVNHLFTLVDSDWMGLNLDIGSYRQHPPYQEIQKNIHKAITWQIKENVWIEDQETPTDFERLLPIIQRSGYRGYLPLETLGPGDPYEKVPVLLDKVRRAM